MNYAAPIFLLALVVALAYFLVTGRKVYTGPVVEIEGRKVHVQHAL